VFDSLDLFLTAWTDAERSGDAPALKTLLTDDFYGVGPLGFVLPRAAWLARHQQGDLDYTTFDLDEVTTQVVGDAAVVTAYVTTRGTYRARPLPEAARATLVVPNDNGTWRPAVIHMSFIAGTPGAPQMPGGDDDRAETGDLA
jgi:ketosteroid isomerase-like protein